MLPVVRNALRMNVRTNLLLPADLVAELDHVAGPRNRSRFVADAVRSGGFPPLLIDPIDFHALYRQRAAEAQQTLSS